MINLEKWREREGKKGNRKEAIKAMVALLGSNKLDFFGDTKLIVTSCTKRAVDLK